MEKDIDNELGNDIDKGDKIEENIYYYRGEQNILENSNLDLDKKLQEIKNILKQNIQNDNLCFLLGSGCSCLDIPLMGRTFDKIKSKIRETYDDEFDFLIKKLKNENDIEGFLNKLNKYIEIIDNEEKLKKYIDVLDITKHMLLESMYESFEKYEDKNKQETEMINFNKLKSKTLNLYRQFYDSIFKLRKSHKAINVFTTNYDLFNEFALEEQHINYTTGFEGILNRKFSPNVFNHIIIDDEDKYKEKWTPIKNYVKLYKLHGSINWIGDNETGIINQIDLSINNIKNDKIENIMIYPTQLKHYETQQIPYSDLFREFSIKLRVANTTLIIIGYGFPDQHINSLISQALGNDSFNLIIFGDKEEVNAKNFYENNKHRKNLHFIGGDKEENIKYHYFKEVIDLINIYNESLEEFK